MTGPAQRKERSSLALALVACAAPPRSRSRAGPSYFEIPIETPIQPKLDVSAFQRVLVAGFVAGGTEDVDANQETVRLLRSQLRSKSSLQRHRRRRAAAHRDRAGSEPDATPRAPPADDAPPTREITPPGDRRQRRPDRCRCRTTIKDEKDLEPYERLFANTAYWKRIGEEYQNPLIVTGTCCSRNRSTSGFVQRDQETFDSFGRRRVVPVRTYMERKGFILRPKFVFIDGRTGATMYSESYREEILYNAQQNTPALSSYFELMDRLVPNFLSALSSQKIRGTRVLLK